MNIILFAIIFIFIVYIICNNKSIENMTNFNLPNEIKYDNETSLSYMPNETTCNIELSSIPKELNYNNYTFNLIGTAINKFYNQKYYLYESKYDQSGDLLIRDNLDYLNEQNYNYLFINFINNEIKIQQEFGPRPKIDIGDIIYLDIKYKFNGISYIGPYLIL